MTEVFVEIDPLTHLFIDTFNELIADDSVLDEHDVSVNPGTKGSLVVYWAHKPSRRQRSRFKRLIRQTRKAILKQDDTLTEADFDYLELESWLS